MGLLNLSTSTSKTALKRFMAAVMQGPTPKATITNNGMGGNPLTAINIPQKADVMEKSQRRGRLASTIATILDARVDIEDSFV